MKVKLALFVAASLMMGLMLQVRMAHGQDAATEEAREHFRKGQQFFDVGRWDEAADEFEKAYAVRSDPTFLFNMAQAYRRKGDAKRAIDLYKNYLIKAPKSPQRAEIEERIRTLQKQLDEAESAPKASPLAPLPASAAPPAPLQPTAAPAPVPAPIPAATPVAAPAAAPTPAPIQASAPVLAQAPAEYPAVPSPPAPMETYPAPATAPLQPVPAYIQAQATPAPPMTQPGRGLRVAGIVTGVVGLTAVTAGIICGAETKAYSDSIQSGTRFDPAIANTGTLFQTLQWVGYGVGAVLVATGAVLYGFGAASASGPSVALAPTALPGGAGIFAQGAF
ncbi:MAG: tetratricopeptide repeat protein [Polyangia bacterium]